MTSKTLASIRRLKIGELFGPAFLKLGEARLKEAFHAIADFTLLYVLAANPHKNQTKSKFFGKARKLNFTPLLHIASPWQEYKQPVLFFSSK